MFDAAISAERDSAFTCANLFWWYNMATSVDIAVTPRPMYPTDGRKIPDCHTNLPTYATNSPNGWVDIRYFASRVR